MYAPVKGRCVERDNVTAHDAVETRMVYRYRRAIGVCINNIRNNREKKKENWNYIKDNDRKRDAYARKSNTGNRLHRRRHNPNPVTGIHVHEMVATRKYYERVIQLAVTAIVPGRASTTRVSTVDHA